MNANPEKQPVRKQGALKRAWLNFSTGGRPDQVGTPLVRQVIFLNYYLLISLLACFVFAPVAFHNGLKTVGIADLAVGCSGLLVFLFMRRSDRVDVAQNIVLAYAFFLMTVLLFTGGIGGTGIFWWYCLPAGAFFLTGRRVGWWWSLAMLSVLGVYAGLLALGRIQGHYTLIQLRQFTVSYFIICVIMYFYSRVRDDWQEIVEQKSLEALKTSERLAAEAWERMQAQVALEEAKKDAERANAAKSEFLSRMSHELRTPMNSILGFSQLMEMDTSEPLTESQRQAVERILASGQDLLKLINEVLDLARIEAGRVPLTLEPVALHSLVEECLAAVKPIADTRGVFLRDDTKEFPALRVTADADRLKEIFLNLLSNAIKYNKPDGLVLIEAQAGEGSVKIRVTDSGVGIPGDKLHLVFEPFQRLVSDSAAVEGTGIGLTIVKRLVEMMGGTIGVESAPGLGSCFSLELPRSEDAPETPASEAVAAPLKGHFGEGGIVLYVEDDPTNLILVKQVMQKRPGTELLLATTGQAGLDVARRRRPDLILLDIHLPDKNGDEVFRELRGAPETKEIPVIVVSASAMPSDVEALLKVGINGYLTKPLDVRLFLEKVDEYLKGALELQGAGSPKS